MKKKRWQEFLRVGEWHYQIDWGNHPRTGDWTTAWTVFNVHTGERATQRIYSAKRDAERGAAQIHNSIEKKLLGPY